MAHGEVTIKQFPSQLSSSWPGANLGVPGYVPRTRQVHYVRFYDPGYCFVGPRSDRGGLQGVYGPPVCPQRIPSGPSRARSQRQSPMATESSRLTLRPGSLACKAAGHRCHTRNCIGFPRRVFAWRTLVHSGLRLSLAFCGPQVCGYGVWNLRDPIAVPLSF